MQINDDVLRQILSKNIKSARQNLNFTQESLAGLSISMKLILWLVFLFSSFPLCYILNILFKIIIVNTFTYITTLWILSQSTKNDNHFYKYIRFL